MRKSLHLLLVFVCAALLVTAAAAQKKAAPSKASADTRAADEKDIRAESVAWFKVGATRDGEKFATYYAPDAQLFPPGAARVDGQEKIRTYWVQFMKAPGLKFGGGPKKIEASRSGDLAYETGVYELILNDPAGRPVKTVGKYVVVWKKQPDGPSGKPWPTFSTPTSKTLKLCARPRVYRMRAVKTSSIANPVRQPGKGSSCRRLSVQMACEVPPKDTRPS